MEHIYRKVDNIDEKVKEANMPYMQWKVLFLVGENTNAEEISSLIEEDISAVQKILTSLESKALIEKVDVAKSDGESDKQPEDTTLSSIGDELLEEEEEVISQVDEQLETQSANPEEEIGFTEIEDIAQDLKEEIPTEPDEKKDEETFSFEEPTSKQSPAPEDIPILEKHDFSEQPFETESIDLSEDEFDLSIDEPETKVAVEEPAEQVTVTTESVDEEIISDSTRKTIMVIDDSIVIRKMIEIALEEEDYKIVTAISGKEGLETIEKDKPNLVILDMMLPDMNGIEVLKIIKKNKNLPVIMLSGKDSPQLIEMAREVGVDDFLPKPFRDEELVEKVKTLIEV